MSTLDPAAVAKMAQLARIRLTDEEAARAQTELSGILTWTEQLAEVDTDGVPPMTSGTGISRALRADTVDDGGRADDVLANAPEAEHGFYLVPKVVE